MVRIHRNDARPRRTVNLVSDEEQEPSSSSSASSNSSNSSSGEVEEKAVISSPSSLSDFIEEDDEPLPDLKSSSSSWEPVKPQRKRRRTLRKKPRLDRIEADDEDSTSSDSTSSDGIPRPQVEVDADDEDGQLETTTTQHTPKKRKRPRRAAAPPCFLDSVNKFVEPMSKEAMKYHNLTLSQILYGESEDNEQAENSDDSSVEYVPCPPGKKVASTTCESEESGGVGENDFDAEKNLRNGDSDESNREHVPRQIRSTGSPPVCIGSPKQSEVVNLSDMEDENIAEVTKRSPASKRSSKRRRRGQHKSSPNSSYREEQEVCSNVLESERNKLEEQNDPEPTGLDLRKSKQGELRNAPIDNRYEGEVIDLCSGDECATIKFEDGAQDSIAEKAHETRNAVAKHAARETVLDTAVTDQRTTEERLKYGVKDGSYSREDDIPALEAGEPHSFSQNEVASPCDMRSRMVPYEGVGSDSFEARKNRESAPFPPAHVEHEDLKSSSINDSKSLHTDGKAESQPHVRNEEARCDPIKEPNRKQEIDIEAVENCIGSDVMSKPESELIQKHLPSTCNFGGNAKLGSSKVVGLRPVHRFNGAKQRGNTPHPDVLNRRVPQSQEESKAWLGFAKAEARDIYRAFTGDAPARTYKCANVEMVFVRQILAQLGKLMGLKVRSEKEESGRRIVLEKSPLGSVAGSEQDAEQAVEGFFYDALADLIDESNKTRLLPPNRISEKRDVNEPPKKSAEETEKIQRTGVNGNASPRANPSRAASDCSRSRGGKRKPSLRVIGKRSKRKPS